MARKVSTIAPKADLLKALVTKSLDASKAVDITCIPLKGKSDLADYIVIASGTSSRHIHAMANQLGEKISNSGLTRFSTEGMGECQWVVVDTPYVMVHLFMPEMRSRYNLEKMWSADFSDSTQSIKI